MSLSFNNMLLNHVMTQYHEGYTYKEEFDMAFIGLL